MNQQASMTPHRCPVCDGRGQVSEYFYAPVVDTWGSTTGGPRMVACRSCENGLVWSMVVTSPRVEVRGGDDLRFSAN